uniref:Uncharacterized protein n=1 Tax=Arundo donax TaxID=35708 RepID=A0A0A9BHZ4_ARUDO
MQQLFNRSPISGIL